MRFGASILVGLALMGCSTPPINDIQQSSQEAIEALCFDEHPVIERIPWDETVKANTILCGTVVASDTGTNTEVGGFIFANSSDNGLVRVSLNGEMEVTLQGAVILYPNRLQVFFIYHRGSAMYWKATRVLEVPDAT